MPPMTPMLPSPSLPLTLLAFLLLLGPLVILHELGHYWVGRLCGVKIDGFSIGFGHELFGWTDRHGTRWKVSLIPLGGYVQFAGDRGATSAPSEEAQALPPEERARCFQFKPLWQRALIVLAGPLANWLVTVAIFAAFNLAYGQVSTTPVISAFAAKSPAREAGLKVGDRITAIDSQSVTEFREISERVLPNPGDRVTVSVLRQGHPLSVTLTIGERVLRDRFGNEERVGLIGIASGRGEHLDLSPWRSLTVAVDQSFSILGQIVGGLRQVILGQRSVQEMGGPVKIAKFAGEQLSLGWQAFVYFAALISINLAFINLLPIPALDGGHLLLYLAEAIRRRPMDQRSQEWVFRTGLALVLALVIFVTLNDIASLHLLSR